MIFPELLFNLNSLGRSHMGYTKTTNALRYLSLVGMLALSSSLTWASGTSKCTSRDWQNVESIPAIIEKVVDGDTIKISYQDEIYNIRMLSIDTPETHFQGKSQGYWGDQAAEELATLVPRGSKVEIVFDEEKCDRYGRLLAYVFKDGVNINLEMVKSGLAVNYCIAPNVMFCKEFGTAVDRNIKKKQGIFSDSTLELPYEWRRQMSRRPHEKYIGNLDTKLVYAPGSLDQVPVGKRIFFMKRQDVSAPYSFAP